MKTALINTGDAVFDRLSNDTTVSGLVTGVYDKVPSDAQYPHIAMGEDTAEPMNSKTSLGETITHTLHTWSAYNGKYESKQILDVVLQALSNSPLPLGGGFYLAAARLVRMRVFQDVSGDLYHGIMTIEFKAIQ